MASVAIVGAGIIGCATALALAARGSRVTVLESTPFAARAASTRAAGILGAQLGRHPNAAMAALCLASRERYPAWVAAMDVGYRRAGSLAVAFDAQEQMRLEAQVEAQQRAGLDAAMLDGNDARLIEPALSSAVIAAAHFPGDAIVDPPRLLDAVRAAAERAGAVFRTSTSVERVDARGVYLASGSLIAADEVVLAAGSWSALVPDLGLPSRWVRPARGQMVELSLEAPPIARVVEGPRGYLSPRADGRVLVGSTVEDVGFEEAVTAGAVAGLLAAAVAMAPCLADARISRTWSGFRAATADELPVIGRAARGLIVATGHFRDGILLAPITAEIVAALVHGEAPPLDVGAFSVARLTA